MPVPEDDTIVEDTLRILLPQVCCRPDLWKGVDGVDVTVLDGGCRLEMDVPTAHRLATYCVEHGWNATPESTSFALRVAARALDAALRGCEVAGGP